MGNSKETICGELLYEFMVHEKGFKISGRWNNHEQKKLLNDFAVMRQLIQLIELEIDVSFGEIKQVVLYLKNADVHVENVLQRKDSDMMRFYGKANVKIYLDGEGEIDDLKKWLISQEEAFAYSSSYLTALIESEIKKNL